MHHTSAVAEIVGGIVLLLLIAAAILALTKRLRLPFTVVLVLVGIALSGLASRFVEALPGLQHLAISPDLILYVFLPTLIFESSLNLDARQLRHNLAPIATLAAPGLVLSTTIIGCIIHLATPITLLPALLLGAILSATDPVAVVAMFKQLGAPQRLTVLVEGESLFNDATSIVVARILLMVIAAGSLSSMTLVNGIIDFFVLFAGGLLTGILLGALIGYLLGLVESDPFIEITLTTVLAYASFLLAEEVLGVSGVMATVGAGVVLGGWGRVKVSPTVRVYLEHFWEQMAFIANALIFLMVGLKVDLHALYRSLGLLAWVIVAMLVARAVIIYGLVPLVGRLPGSRPVSRRYQTVMFWGGLRGAIAIAIVLSLPELEHAETFVALVMGAVLFTLLAQGLSIEWLMRRLGLDQPPLADLMALLERDLLANQQGLARLRPLQAGGLLSAPLAWRLGQRCEKAIERTRDEINALRRRRLDERYETAFLYLRAFAEEKSFYDRMYNDGHLSEGAYRELALVLTLQIDAVRYQGAFAHVHSHRVRRLVEKGLYRLLDCCSLLAPLAERLRMHRVIRNYEEVWCHYQGSGRVLEYLRELSQLEETPAEVLAEVSGHYRHWQQLAGEQLDLARENFPEFVAATQVRLGRRVLLLAQVEATEAQMARGMLPRGMAEASLEELNSRINALRGERVARLRLDPLELLRKVPLFQEFDDNDLEQLAAIIRPHTIEAGSVIVEQGEVSDSLYLIARGVVRVWRQEEGEERECATLMAGDFFGEMGLMHHENRNATVRSVSPCLLYELKRDDFDALVKEQPRFGKAVQRIDALRRQTLASGGKHSH